MSHSKDMETSIRLNTNAVIKYDGDKSYENKLMTMQTTKLSMFTIQKK